MANSHLVAANCQLHCNYLVKCPTTDLYSFVGILYGSQDLAVVMENGNIVKLPARVENSLNTAFRLCKTVTVDDLEIANWT